MPTKQSTAYKESRRTSSTRNTSRTMAGNSTDIIGLLLRSNDKNTMMIIVDQFKKMIGLKIITIIVPSEEIAKIYSDNI